VIVDVLTVGDPAPVLIGKGSAETKS